MSTDFKKVCKEAKDAIEEASKVKKKAADDVVQALKEHIKNSEYIKGVSWSQYVPGFNDGDVCEFTLNDVEVQLVDELDSKLFPKDENDKFEYEDDETEFEGFHSLDSIENAIERTTDILNNSEIKPIQKAVKEINDFNSFLGDIEETLEQKWGANTRIIVTKKGITTEDYDCGY